MNYQQKGLITLFSVEFFERFSYWGLQSILVLYLNQVLNISYKETFEVFGAFTALAFMFSITGGFLADRYFGFRFSVVAGILISVLGNIFLIFNNIDFTYIGLALILLGNGLFTPNCSNLLSTLYEVNDTNRNKDFTLLYMGTNLGGLLGPIIYGILATSIGWHFGFIISSITLSAWLIFFLCFKNVLKYKGLPPPTKLTKKINLSKQFICFFLPTTILVLFLLKNVGLTGKFLSFFGLVSIAFLSWNIKKYNLKDRFLLVMITAMILFSLLFFSIEFQVNSSLLEFIESNVNRNFFGWHIPTSFFASLEPFFVIALAPFFAFLWKTLDKKEINPMYKIITGLFLGGIGFYVFSYSAHLAYISGEKISTSLIIIGNIFLGAGEICLMPTVISSITKYAPEKIKSTMTGMLYLSLSFSGYISGIIATLTVPKINTSKFLTLNYFHTYENIGFFTLAICLTSSLVLFLINYFFVDEYAKILKN